MESFVFDVNAFFGEPKSNEQSSNVIIDPRKHLKTLKILEMPNKEISAKHIKQSDVSGGAIKMGKGCKKETGTCKMQAGAIKMGNNGGALAFNEEQLMSELSNLKKGGSLTGLAASIIPALIQLAPEIINSIKSAKKSGGAIKFGGASFIFLQGIDAANYDEMLKLFKAIERQKKNLIREGGAILTGSGKMGEFFKKSWNNLKSFYANNKDRLKPITDILLNSATKAANKYIDKGVNYVANKTGSDTIKQISNVVGNMAKDTVNNTIEDVRNYEGGSYDINKINEENKTKVNKKKSKKIIVSTDNNQNHVTENLITRKRVY